MKRFKTIQILRALACIYVLLCHLTYYFKLLFPASPLSSLVYYGYSGVDMFFVISGFVIYTSTQNIEENFRSFLSYFKKRIIRIYPIYWIVLIFSLIETGSLIKSSFKNVAGDFLLIPHYTSIDVTWTLCFELYFYIVFGIGLIKKQLKIIPWIVFAASLFYFIAGRFIDVTHFPLPSLFRYQVIEFFLGVAAGALYKKIPTKLAYLFIIAGIVCFFSRNILGHPVFNYALPSMLLIMGLVKIESVKKLYVPAFIILLGDASYAIYLIHDPLLRDTILYNLETTNRLNKINFCLFTLAIIVAGVLIHLYLEKPLLRLLNKKITTRQQLN
jgi:exopolysaccharide production protein ExoZ